MAKLSWYIIALASVHLIDIYSRGISRPDQLAFKPSGNSFHIQFTCYQTHSQTHSFCVTDPTSLPKPASDTAEMISKTNFEMISDMTSEIIVNCRDQIKDDLRCNF